jgi:hypothetical protein
MRKSKSTKAKAAKLSESDLAAFVVNYMKDRGYTVYGEVLNKAGARADMYCVNGSKSVSIETKTTFSLKVIEQAYQWLGQASEIYVAVPKALNYKERYFAMDVCSMYGIGVIEVDTNQKYNNVTMLRKAAICSKPNMPKLYEEQQDSVAGNANNDYVTPFKLTVRAIQEFIDGQQPLDLRYVIRQVKHHYASENSAYAALTKLISAGVLDSVKIMTKGKKRYIYLD